MQLLAAIQFSSGRLVTSRKRRAKGRSPGAHRARLTKVVSRLAELSREDTGEPIDQILNRYAVAGIGTRMQRSARDVKRRHRDGHQIQAIEFAPQRDGRGSIILEEFVVPIEQRI